MGRSTLEIKGGLTPEIDGYFPLICEIIAKTRIICAISELNDMLVQMIIYSNIGLDN